VASKRGAMLRRLALPVLLAIALGATVPAHAASGHQLEIFNPRGLRFTFAGSGQLPIKITMMGVVGDAVTSVAVGAPEVAKRTMVCFEVALSFGSFRFSFVNCIVDVHGLRIAVDETLSTGSMKGKVGGGSFAGQEIAAISVDVKMRSSQQQMYEPLDDPTIWYDDPDLSGRIAAKDQMVSASGALYTRRGLPTGELSHPLIGSIEPTRDARFLQFGGAIACKYERSASTCYREIDHYRVGAG